MAYIKTCQILYPVALAVATLARYTAPSIVYLLFFLAYFSLRPIQRQLGLKQWFIKDRYFIVSFVFSILSLLTQVVFQIFFATTSGNDERFIVRLFGLQRYDKFVDGLQYLGPDLLMVAFNLLVILGASKKRRSKPTRAAHVMKPTIYRVVQWVWIIILLLAAISFPSWASVPYFIVFTCYFFSTFYRRYVASTSDVASHYWDLNLSSHTADEVLDVGTNLPILDSTGKVIDPSDYVSPDIRADTQTSTPSTKTRGANYLGLKKFTNQQHSSQTIFDVANVTRQRTQSTAGYEPSQLHDVGGASTAVSPSEEVLQLLSQYPNTKTAVEMWILRILTLYLAAHMITLYVVSTTDSWYTKIPRQFGLISPFGWGDAQWSLAFVVFLFHIICLVVLFIITSFILGVQAQFKTLIELIAYGQYTFNLGLNNPHLDQVETVPQLNLNRQHYDRFIGDCLSFQFYQASLWHPSLKERRRMETREGNFDAIKHPIRLNPINPVLQRVPSTTSVASQPSLQPTVSTGSLLGIPENNTPLSVIHSRFATHETIHTALNPRAQKNSNISSTLFAAWDAVRVELFVLSLYLARMACHIILLTSALFRPSIAGFINIFFFTLTCILSSSYFKKVTPIISIYAFFYAACLYICTIPGLVPSFRSAVPLGLDAPSAPFFAVLNAISPALVCGLIFRWCSLTPMDIQALEIRELKKDISFKKDQRIRVLYFIRALLMYLSDKFALLMLFFTALYMVNVIHAIFLVTFIVFLSMTKIARLLWPLLVYYSGIILLILYAYGIIQPWAHPGTKFNGQTDNGIVHSGRSNSYPSTSLETMATSIPSSSPSSSLSTTAYSNDVESRPIRSNSSLSQFTAQSFSPLQSEHLTQDKNANQEPLPYQFQSSLFKTKPGLFSSLYTTVVSYLPAPPSINLQNIKILSVPSYQSANGALDALFTSDNQGQTPESESNVLAAIDQGLFAAFEGVTKGTSRLFNRLVDNITNAVPSDLRERANKPILSPTSGPEQYVMQILQTTGTSVVDIIGLFVPKDKLDWWGSLALYYCLFIVAAFQWNVYASVVTSNVNSMFEHASPAWTAILNTIVTVVAYLGVLFCSLPYRPSIIKFISAMFVIVSLGLHTFIRKPHKILKVLWFAAVVYLAVVFVALYLFQFDTIQVWFTNLYPSTRFTVEDLGFEIASKKKFGVLQSMSGPVFAFILSVIYLRFLSAEIKRAKENSGAPTVEEYYELLTQRGALLGKEERQAREELLLTEKNARIQSMLSAVRERQDVISQDVTRKRNASMAAWHEHQAQQDSDLAKNPFQINPILLAASERDYGPPQPPTPSNRRRLGSVSAKNYQTLTRNNQGFTTGSGAPLVNEPPRPSSPPHLAPHAEEEEEEGYGGFSPYPPPNPPPKFGGGGDETGYEGEDSFMTNNEPRPTANQTEEDLLNDDVDRNTSSQSVPTQQVIGFPAPVGGKKKNNFGGLFHKNQHNNHPSAIEINLPTSYEQDSDFDDEAVPPPPLQTQPEHTSIAPPETSSRDRVLVPSAAQQQQQQQQLFQLPPQPQTKPQIQPQTQPQSLPFAQQQPASRQSSNRDNAANTTLFISSQQQQPQPQQPPTPAQDNKPFSSHSQEIKALLDNDLPTERTVAFWLLILLPKYIYDFSYYIATMSHKQMYKVVFIFAWLLISEIQSTNILNFVLLVLMIGFLFFNRGQSAWAPIHLYSIVLFTSRYIFQIGQFDRDSIKKSLAYIGFTYWGTKVNGTIVFDKALVHTYGECILIVLTCVQSIAYHHWRPKKISPQEAQAKEYEKWLNKKEKKIRRAKLLERDVARKKLEFYQDQLAMETLMQQNSADGQISGAVEQLIQAKLNNAIQNLQKAREGSAASDDGADLNGLEVNIAGNDPSLDASLFQLDSIPTYNSQFNQSPTLGRNNSTALPLNRTMTSPTVQRPGSSARSDKDVDSESDSDEEFIDQRTDNSPVGEDISHMRRLPSAYAFTSGSSSRMNQMRRTSILQVAQNSMDQSRPMTAAAAAGHQRPGSSSEFIPKSGGSSKASSARLPWCSIFFKILLDLLTRLVTFIFSSFPIIGMQLTFFLMLAAAIYRANVMSIVDVFGIVGCYVMLGRKRVAVGWSIIIAILSIRVLWQFWMTMGTNSESPWWQYPWHNLADHYQRWLLLGHFPASELHFEAIAILVSCMQRKYWNILIRLNKNPLLALSDIDHSKQTADLTPAEIEKRRKHYQAYLHQQRQLRKLNLIASDDDANPDTTLADGAIAGMDGEQKNDGSFLLTDDHTMTSLEKHHRFIQLSRVRVDDIHTQQLAYVRYQQVDLEHNILNPMVDFSPDPYLEVQVPRTGFNRDLLLDGSQDETIKLYAVNGFVPPTQERNRTFVPNSNLNASLARDLDDKTRDLWHRMLADQEYQAFLQKGREAEYYNYYHTVKPSPYLRIAAGLDYVAITGSPEDDTSLLTQWDTDTPSNTGNNTPTAGPRSSNSKSGNEPPALLSPTQRVLSSNRFIFSPTADQRTAFVSAASPVNSPTTDPNPPSYPNNDILYASVSEHPSILTLGVKLDFTLSVSDVSHLNALNHSQYSIESMLPYDPKMYRDTDRSITLDRQPKTQDDKTFNPAKQIKEANKNASGESSPSATSASAKQRALWDESQQVSSIVHSVWPFLRFLLMLISDKIFFIIIFALVIARANLVRVGYLILTLGLIIDKSLYIGEISQTRQFWTTLQRYNILILSFITIYQCPFIPDFLSSNFIINGSDIASNETISWVKVIGIQRYRDKGLDNNGFSGDAALHYILIFLFVEIQRCLFVSEPYLDVIHFFEMSRAQSELKGRVTAQARSDQRDLEIVQSKHTTMVLDEEFQGILNSVEQIEYAMSSKHHRQLAKENPNAASAGGLQTPQPTPVSSTSTLSSLRLKETPTTSTTKLSGSSSSHFGSTSRSLEQQHQPQSFFNPRADNEPLPPPATTPLLDSTTSNSSSIDDSLVSYNFFDDRLIWSDPTPSNWSTAVEEEQLHKQLHNHLEESKLLQMRHQLELFNIEMEVRKEVLHNYHLNQELLQSKDSLIQDSATQQKLVKRIEDRKKKKASRRREIKCKNFLLRHLRTLKLFLLRGIDPVLLHTYGEYYGNIVEMPSKSTPEEKSFFHLLYLLLCTHSQIIVLFFMLLNAWINPSFLTLIALAAFLIIGILQSPRASSSFISFLFVYISVISIAQFTFQMPIFCVETLSRTYSLQPNPQCFLGTSSQDLWKKDYLFGLIKGREYLFLSWQLIVLLALAWHRTVLISRGLWYKSEEDLGDPALQRSIEFHEKKAELDKELAKRDRFLKHYEKNIRAGTDPTLITADLRDPRCSTHCWLRCLPQELKRSYFEIIPRSGLAMHAIKPGTDLYSFGFLLELISAIWIVAFFTEMAATSISISAAISSSFFQGEMVIALAVQTLFIVLDRIAYLKRSLLFKLVLHIAGIIYWGYSIMFVWPVNAMRGFWSQNGFIQFFFLLKSVFYIISATQIQLGYPPQDSPVMQTLTKDVGLFRYLAFRVYRALPFVYELRIILDWYCSKTSLDLWDTFKLDDIYSTLYIAQRLIWVRNKKARGKSVDCVERFFTGIVLFVGLVVVLFIPLLLFSSANPGSTPNYVQSVVMGIRIETPKGSYPLSAISSLTRIEQASSSIYKTMRQRYMVDRADSAQALQVLTLSTESDASWDISRGSIARLTKDLEENYKPDAPPTSPSPIHLDVQLAFTRDNPPERQTVSIIESVPLDYVTLQKILGILQNTETSFDVAKAIPKFYRLPATADPIILGDKSDATGIKLTLIQSAGDLPYWRVEAISSVEGITVYTVSNPVWSVAFLAGIDYSIVAIYTLFLSLIGGFVRQIFAGNAARMIIEELPSVDRLLRFCQGIYIARAHGLLLQEEELFRKLVRIYRSPEKLVHLTARRARGPDGGITKKTNALPVNASLSTNSSHNNPSSRSSDSPNELSRSADFLPQSGETSSLHRRRASMALKAEQDNVSKQLHQQIQALEYSRQQSKRRQ